MKILIALIAGGTIVWAWRQACRDDGCFEPTAATECLNAANTSSLRRIEVKQAIVDELIEGQVNLDEAIRQFLELNEIEPSVKGHACWVEKVDDDYEANGLVCIRWVRKRLERSPERLEMIESALRKELKELLANRASAGCTRESATND